MLHLAPQKTRFAGFANAHPPRRFAPAVDAYAPLQSLSHMEVRPTSIVDSFTKNCLFKKNTDVFLETNRCRTWRCDLQALSTVLQKTVCSRKTRTFFLKPIVVAQEVRSTIFLHRFLLNVLKSFRQQRVIYFFSLQK